MDHLEPDAGSFRDPASRVYLCGDRVVRAVDAATHETLAELSQSGLLKQLVTEGLLIATRPLEPGSLVPLEEDLRAGRRHLYEHPRLPLLSWPYEWTVSMLADAALLTLRVQRRLIEAGYSLKDASAFNVQFVRGMPMLIDAGSIERAPRRDVWYALGQFSQMFTFPLLLCRYAGWDPRSYFLGHLGGRDVRQVTAAFGRWGWLRPGLLWDVTLPAWLTRRVQERKPLAVSQESAASGSTSSPAAQLLNLRRLERKIARLAVGYRPRGPWSRYGETCSYDEAARQAKLAAVERFLRETRPARVLDLGCNTGEYSLLADRCGAEVLAVDSDHDAVEVFYRSVRGRGLPITPGVIDLCQPSPGVGLMNGERAPWLDRAPSDCVLALALLHHLVVSGNLSLEAVCDLLSRLSLRDLVLEFVPTDDPQFRRLLEFRRDRFDGLTLSACREVFCRRFELLREEPIAGSGRTLMFCRKRGE